MPGDEQPQLPRSFAVPLSIDPGALAGKLATRLRSHVRRFDLGTVMAAGTGFVLRQDPLTVRAPAVAFVSRDRMGVLALVQGYFPGAPDLAVEVVEETEGADWLEEQAEGYFRAGAQQVWQIFPRQHAMVVRRGSRGVILQAADTLEGGALLPGFTCRVAELFE